MPLYEYQCPSCSILFEVSHSIIKQPRIQCPRCFNRRGNKKLIRSVSVAFKGEGFTKATHQVQLSDGRRGTVGEYGFEQIKKVDPDARLIKV